MRAEFYGAGRLPSTREGRAVCAALLAACLFASPAHAAEPAAGQQLQETQAALERSQAKEKALAAEKGKVESELGGLQKNLVQLADTIRKNERGLLDAEDKLAILHRQVEEKNAALAEQRQKLSAMTRAAIRLSRTPPEAAVMMPGEFGGAVKAARVLSALAQSIRRETQSISAQLAELEALKIRVRQNREKIGEDQLTLKSQQLALDAMLGERRRLAARLLKEQEEVRARVAELSRQSKDLRELLSGLEQQRRQREEKERRAETPRVAPKAPKRLRSMAKAKGKLDVPAAGKVLHRFGEALSRNETSRGVVIKTIDGAKVVAPYDAEVVFTGPFLNYGTMAILRHSEGFHTLLAGFDVVNVSVGQFLLEGEPIGAMGKDPAGTDLYVELRQQNQPINPVPWMPGLH